MMEKLFEKIIVFCMIFSPMFGLMLCFCLAFELYTSNLNKLTVQFILYIILLYSSIPMLFVISNADRFRKFAGIKYKNLSTFMSINDFNNKS